MIFKKLVDKPLHDSVECRVYFLVGADEFKKTILSDIHQQDDFNIKENN